MNPPLPPLAERLRSGTADARRALAGERKKTLRLLVKLEQDAAACAGGEQLRLAGEVLKTALDRVHKGADHVVLAVPWLADGQVDVPLQRDLTPRQNLERIFRRAKGLTQGLRIVEERRRLAESRLGTVADLLAQADALIGAAEAFDRQEPDAGKPRHILRELDTWLAAVRAAGIRLSGASLVPTAESAHVVRQVAHRRELPEGVRLFRSPAGSVVIAGKSATGNDALVTRLMRGRDVWLHLRDRPGAHVLLRVSGTVAPPEPEVRACAMLAGHLSGVSKGEPCDITVCAGKDVRKVKGAPAGSVYLSRERVLRVVVDAGVIDGFYARNR